MIPAYVVGDIETEGYNGPIERIGIGTAEKIWTLPWSADVRDRVAALLGRADVMKVFHNIQFDAPKLRDQGAPVAPPWWDTMLAGQLIEPDLPKALRSMAPLYLDVKPWKHLAHTNPELYNATDIATTRALFLAQWEILERDGMLGYFQQVLMPGVPVLIGQYELGLTVDLEEYERLERAVIEYLMDATQVWYKMCSVDPASPQKLIHYFYTDLGLPVQRDKDTRKPSVAMEALEELRFLSPEHGELLDALLEIRRAEKLHGTYLKMPGVAQGRVHARMLPRAKDEEGEAKNKGAGSTGRLGASPNLMNVPGDWKHRGNRISEREAADIVAQGGKVLPPMRSMFVPRRRGDVFVEIDKSQLELRIIAARSGDEAMQYAIEHDIHERTRLAVERVSGKACSRVLAKNYNYLTWYGGKPRGLVNFFKGKGIRISLSDAIAGQTAIAQEYAKAWAWKADIERRVVQQGWLREPMGRKRHFYGGSRDVTEGVDFIPQAGGASMLWSDLPIVWNESVKMNCHFPLTVHDSYLIEAPADEARVVSERVREVLERPHPQFGPGFWVPTDVKVGVNWGKMEKLNVKEQNS